jgi:hypothetical protein
MPNQHVRVKISHVPAMACKPPEKSPPEMAALAATTKVYGSTIAICNRLLVSVAAAALGFSLDFTGSVGWFLGANGNNCLCKLAVVPSRRDCSCDTDNDDDGTNAEQVQKRLLLLLLLCIAERLAAVQISVIEARAVQRVILRGSSCQRR